MKFVRPCENFKYNEQEEIAKFLNDLNSSDIILDNVTADNPKRSSIKGCKSASSKYPCEYCESCAVTFKDNTMTRSKLTWPPQTMNGRPRTITGIKRIVNSIERQEEEEEEEEEEGEAVERLGPHDLKGIKHRSALLDQPNFDFILDCPSEYMHLVCIGVVKKMLEFSYKVGSNKTRVTKRKKCYPKEFNDLIIFVLVPYEFSRRLRNLDTSVLKAQEYRNILLFLFPIVLKNIGEKYKKERQLWLSLVFMIRSCILPNEEYDEVNKETIQKSCELFYNLFFEVYGQKNCVYSIHVVSSHLFKVRGNEPLTERSAFKFESFYSEMKNLFKSGTKSPLKQILRNTIIKRKLEFHTCKKTILYAEKKKEKNTLENNHLVYTFINNQYNLYVINEINGDLLTCQKQGKFQYKPDLLPNHDWKSIGVFRRGPVGSDTSIIPKKDIKGKVLSVLDMLITCPENVLQEK